MGERQHRLIHLCEKRVVVPEVEDARGRGHSRRFSDRNLLEFAVALKLRSTLIPVATVASVVRILEQCERRVAKEIPGFSLPQSLRTQRAPDLRIIISDGRRLYVTLGKQGGPTKVFGGIDLTGRRNARTHGKSGPRAPGKSIAAKRGAFGIPEGSRHVRVEVSVTQIAKDLPLQG
jgi:hypothetical protein